VKEYSFVVESLFEEFVVFMPDFNRSFRYPDKGGRRGNELIYNLLQTRLLLLCPLPPLHQELQRL
jgi:hypothetical protein